jgi:hypothetical protein
MWGIRFNNLSTFSGYRVGGLLASRRYGIDLERGRDLCFRKEGEGKMENVRGVDEEFFGKIKVRTECIRLPKALDGRSVWEMVHRRERLRGQGIIEVTEEVIEV